MTRTLLLADDSVTIQRVIALTFADRDVSVVAVGDGDAALRALSSSAPDIVLADIDMPGPSGYDIARHVHQTPELRHVPVLLLAGAFEAVDLDRVRASGCDGVLEKPFEPEEVIRRVNELLAAPRGASSVEGPALAEPAIAELEIAEPAILDPAIAEPAPPAAPLPPAVPLQAVVPLPAVPRPVETKPTLDEYFDQLDRAFAERFAQSNRPEPFQPAPEEAPVEAPEPVEAPRPLLASAFSALLDAEQADGNAAKIPDWMVADARPSAADAALVDAITRRVLERLSDRVVRETVTELVSATAERLVLQEIERIKSNIK